MPADNVAIATRRLEEGTLIEFESQPLILSHTVLEGHRFAVKAITKGEALTSWGMAFGTALCNIEPGTYVINDGVIEALKGRAIDFDLPNSPNFTDDIPAYSFNAAAFKPGTQVERLEKTLHFRGFKRSGQRGVGTRNFIAVVGLSSRTAGFVRRLVGETADWAETLEHIDGIVPVAHTEGDDALQLNKALVLRTLAGFLVHPNVGAVLIVDHASSSIRSEDLKAFLKKEGYPIDQVLHEYLTLNGAYADRLNEGKTVLEHWLAPVNEMRRSKQPASNLKIALQCGGSDAFSGISGNPLAGWVAKAIIQQGGSANLAETDELIGAESYVLQSVKSESVARRFLKVVDRFQNRALRHGSSAAGNPSGGNKFRGLYNIYLKSLGAAMKRHPDVRLDDVIEYGEPMSEPGYYFMDSPGNDLESIAGQVASGCNMIFFVTGNGSITNFPFVPTIKIVTTTLRFEQMAADMDINAGAYLDGTPMDQLGQYLISRMLDVASGELSVGEIAGHAQVQLWRNWRLQEGQSLDHDPGNKQYSGIPILIRDHDGSTINKTISSGTDKGVGLVLPTSLCSGQIGNIAVDQLNASGIAEKIGVRSFVSLVHTEGCGASSGASEQLFLRTMCGYLTHPEVSHAMLLEHGCEKTHNDYFRNYLESEGIDTTRFGWASIQSDGGIEHVLAKIKHWFARRAPREVSGAGNRMPVIGLLATQEPSEALTQTLASLTTLLVDSGSTVLLPSGPAHDPFVSLKKNLTVQPGQEPSLNCAQRIEKSGFHLMLTPSWHLQELLTSMGATGVEVLVVVSNDAAMPAHPFIPTLQVGDTVNGDTVNGDTVNGNTVNLDLDWHPSNNYNEDVRSLANLLLETWGKRYIPRNQAYGNNDFQVSRGWKGISL